MMEQRAAWMGSCLQSCEEPCEHSAWQSGRMSQVTSKLPVVHLRPTDISPPDTHPTLSAQNSTEDRDSRPPDSHRSTLPQSRAPQESCLPTARPSSGVTMTGPPGHHVPTNLLLPRRRTSPQAPLPTHGDEGSWHCPGNAPSGGQAWCGQL